MLGRELEEVFPVAFLPQNHALAVAIMSYNGRIGFGLLADYDSMEDVDVIAEGIDESLAELEEAAAAAAGRPDGRLSRPEPMALLVSPLHRRPDRRALRDHPGRGADRGLPTLALLLADALLGSLLLRHQGRGAWRRFNEALAERRFPGREVADGLMIAIGGTLLLTPGFVTDIFGLILLIPPTRAIVRRLLRVYVGRRFVVVGGRADAASGAARPRRRPRLRLRRDRRGDRRRGSAASQIANGRPGCIPVKLS